MFRVNMIPQFSLSFAFEFALSARFEYFPVNRLEMSRERRFTDEGLAKLARNFIPVDVDVSDFGVILQFPFIFGDETATSANAPTDFMTHLKQTLYRSFFCSFYHDLK